MDKRFTITEYYDCESTWGYAMPVLEDECRCAAATFWFVNSVQYPVQCKNRRTDGKYCCQHARIHAKQCAHSASEPRDG